MKIDCTEDKREGKSLEKRRDRDRTGRRSEMDKTDLRDVVPALSESC